MFGKRYYWRRLISVMVLSLSIRCLMGIHMHLSEMLSIMSQVFLMEVFDSCYGIIIVYWMFDSHSCVFTKNCVDYIQGFLDGGFRINFGNIQFPGISFILFYDVASLRMAYFIFALGLDETGRALMLFSFFYCSFAVFIKP